jgi:hypothetical protein
MSTLTLNSLSTSPRMPQHLDLAVLKARLRYLYSICPRWLDNFCLDITVRFAHICVLHVLNCLLLSKVTTGHLQE